MTKEETFNILVEIKSYWDRFEINQERINKWHIVLKDYEFETVLSNLIEYVKTSRFPPAVADLLKLGERRDIAVPDQSETLAMFKKWEDNSKTVATQEEREAALAKMREILKIGVDPIDDGPV